MKKILTVSLFAMMAVSAANADIASTKYVDDIAKTKQASLGFTPENVANKVTDIPADTGDLTDAQYPSAKAMVSYVGDELATMQTSVADLIDPVANRVAAAESNITSLQSNKANKADVYTKTQVYTKTEADTQFMDSTEVSTAITNAVTGANGALKDYVTKTALGESQSTQDTNLKKYADDAAATAKSGAEATAASALKAYKTSNDTAVAAAKKAGDDAQADLNAYKTSNNAALALKANIAQGSTNANKAVITNASGDITTGTITSGMITDKTIVNADISDTAEIAQSKISGLTTALSGKQATINDLESIRTGAAAGATALQKADIDTGANNGTIKVDDKNVAVKGLGSAAYTASSAYATSAQGTKADNAVAKTDIGVGANFTIPDECKAENAVCSLVVRKGVAGWEKVTY